MNLKRANAGELSTGDEVFYSDYRYQGEFAVSIENDDFEKVTVIKAMRGISPEDFDLGRKHSGYPPVDPPHKTFDLITIETNKGRIMETAHYLLWVKAEF